MEISTVPFRQTSGSTQSGACIFAEAFPAATADAGVLGFVLSLLGKADAPLLWVQDRQSSKETGSAYLPGLRHKAIIQVNVSRPADVLWAMEEGLHCKGLSGVIGEIWGDPPALSFTATKRLAMRAEANNLPCWLIRCAASPNLSAARNRWRIASLPSLPDPHDPQAPGAPRWQAELFRSRTQPTGIWVASYDRTADRLDFAAPLRNGAVAADHGTARRRTAR